MVIPQGIDLEEAQENPEVSADAFYPVGEEGYAFRTASEEQSSDMTFIEAQKADEICLLLDDTRRSRLPIPNRCIDHRPYLWGRVPLFFGF